MSCARLLSYREGLRCTLLTKSRFFETSSLAIVTILIQHFKIEPHPKFSGESFEALKERYSQAKSMMMLM